MGITLLVIGTVSGLTVYILYQSIKTGEDRAILKVVSDPSHMEDNCICCEKMRKKAAEASAAKGDPKQRNGVIIVNQVNTGKICGRCDKNKNIKIGDPNQLTYYFPPVEIHAHDIFMWELKCSGEDLDEVVGYASMESVYDNSNNSNHGNSRHDNMVLGDGHSENESTDHNGCIIAGMTDSQIQDAISGETCAQLVKDYYVCQQEEELDWSRNSDSELHTRNSPPLPPYPLE